jgi:hypothetical protein
MLYLGMFENYIIHSLELKKITFDWHFVISLCVKTKTFS